MQSETGFPSSHRLKSYVAYKSRLKLAARAVLSADAGLLVKHMLADIFFVVYPVSATGSGSPGLPVPAVERDWLMCDGSQYCLFPCVLLGIILCVYLCSPHYYGRPM